jgi:hypothetical protein
MAQIEAAATAVANIVDTLEFVEEFGLVVKLVALPVERMASGSLEAPLAIVGHCVLRHVEIAEFRVAQMTQNKA